MNRRVLLVTPILAFGLIATAVGCSSPASDQPPTNPGQASTGQAKPHGQRTVVYSVTGTASSVSVTYSADASGSASQEAGQRVPYTKTLQVSPGSFVYLSAQNQGASGDVTCQIAVDGKVLASNTSSGGYTICQANGSA